MIYRHRFGSPAWGVRNPFEELKSMRDEMDRLFGAYSGRGLGHFGAGVFPSINLSEDQKVKLLKVREQTVSNVQRLKKAIAPLEVRVAERILAGATPNELNPLVQKIASLKAEATMTHLRCIHDTQLILSKEQLDFLMKR